MTDPEYTTMLADALERLADMADPGSEGDPLTKEDQAAILTVVLDRELCCRRLSDLESELNAEGEPDDGK